MRRSPTQPEIEFLDLKDSRPVLWIRWLDTFEYVVVQHDTVLLLTASVLNALSD